MDPSFWHERWRDGHIGFHRNTVNPQLAAWWSSLELAPDSRVLVPLCGKSVDLGWLAAQGHQVTGIELSGIAVAAFFEEAGLTPTITEMVDHVRWSVPGVEIWQGDFFQMPLETPWDALWDRAALIALPPRLRARYAAQLARMVRPGGRGLLVTLDYPQTERDGPPFSVPATEVATHLGEAFELTEIDLIDDPHPDLGVTRLHEHLWRLARRS